MLLCALITAVLGAQLPRVSLNASFERMIPTDHPFIQNYLKHRTDIGDSNVLRIVVENRKGSILDPEYLEILQRINDAVYLIPGIDRPFMKSLWTANNRWTGITEEGLAGGPIIDSSYDASPTAIERVRQNIFNSDNVGSIVANDFMSSTILIPILDVNTLTHQPLDYGELTRTIEAIRGKYQSDKITIHVVGFAEIVGDLIAGMTKVLGFFAAALVIATAVVFWYTRCVRSTAIVVFCSLIAVIWELGLLPVLGFDLDPYSILVPFLVFAIGMSHGAQKMNGVMQDIGRGADKLVAARFTFRRLFMAGFSALICDAVGFAVLLLIKISVIQELALIASIGVLILVFTNLILLPILLSYTGVNGKAAVRSLRSDLAEQSGAKRHVLWRTLDCFTRPKVAASTIVLAVILGGIGWYFSRDLQIGDISAGAPELRGDSLYNRDNAYLVHHYATSSDVFEVMVATAPDQCADYDTLRRIDNLDWRLRQLPGVETTISLPGVVKALNPELTEGYPKWYELPPNQAMINELKWFIPRDTVNQNCSLSTIRVYLTDHKAATLNRVAGAVGAYAEKSNSSKQQFLLAAGNSGIDAATNAVVEKASNQMLFWVYGAVTLLCLITFRSWRAVICAVLPLILTSLLTEALMVALGIGVKVATLPVIALGVGIGVDYALYILSIIVVNLRRGLPLSEAYYQALVFTGRVVLLTGCTLAIGVATWIFSPIKFQADMGLLLAFCFLWNMLGALILLPSLAVFLLKPTVAASAGGASPRIPEDRGLKSTVMARELEPEAVPSGRAERY
jgi:predicted RND superfamily exporter protein